MAANSFSVSTDSPVSLAATEVVSGLILGVLVKTVFDESALFMMATKAKCAENGCIVAENMQAVHFSGEHSPSPANNHYALGADWLFDNGKFFRDGDELFKGTRWLLFAVELPKLI